MQFFVKIQLELSQVKQQGPRGGELEAIVITKTITMRLSTTVLITREFSDFRI